MLLTVTFLQQCSQTHELWRLNVLAPCLFPTADAGTYLPSRIGAPRPHDIAAAANIFSASSMWTTGACSRHVRGQPRLRRPGIQVTGLLIFNYTLFAQVLEGDFATIENTFGRISRDARHTLPSVLQKTAIAQRSFGAWTMCARQLSLLDNDILDRFEQQGTFSPLAVSGARLQEQLCGIGRVHQAAFDRADQGRAISLDSRH